MLNKHYQFPMLKQSEKTLKLAEQIRLKIESSITDNYLKHILNEFIDRKFKVVFERKFYI